MTRTTYEELKSTKGLTTNLQRIERKIRKMKPIARSVVASHIWFNLCDFHKPEEMAGIKSMINYKTTPLIPEESEDALRAFGFTADYAHAALKSTRSLKRVYSGVASRLLFV
tara:strand:- start:339 stop:674 length:336 start_codon:yes stop_codon:yes gene_type:complete